MKKMTMPITLEPDTAEFLQRMLADTGMSEDQSRYINDLIRRDRDRRGVACRDFGDDREQSPLSDEELMEVSNEMDIPAAD